MFIETLIIDKPHSLKWPIIKFFLIFYSIFASMFIETAKCHFFKNFLFPIHTPSPPSSFFFLPSPPPPFTPSLLLFFSLLLSPHPSLLPQISSFFPHSVSRPLSLSHLSFLKSDGPSSRSSFKSTPTKRRRNLGEDDNDLACTWPNIVATSKKTMTPPQLERMGSKTSISTSFLFIIFFHF